MDPETEFKERTGLAPFDAEKFQEFLTSSPNPPPDAEKLSHVIFCASIETPCLWGGDGQVPVIAVLSSDNVELTPRIMIRAAVPEQEESFEILGIPAVRALAVLWDLYPAAPCLRLEPLMQAFLQAADLRGPLCLAWLKEVDQEANWSSVQVSWA